VGGALTAAGGVLGGDGGGSKPSVLASCDQSVGAGGAGFFGAAGRVARLTGAAAGGSACFAGSPSGTSAPIDVASDFQWS
jgi:hypothetical protein